MRFFIFLGLGVLFVSSCQKSDYQEASDNIVSSVSNNRFEKLLILVNLKNTDSTYVLTEQVDSVEIYLNDQFLGSFTSSAVDVDLIASFPMENLNVTTQKINYLIQAEQDYSLIEVNTAGDYAAILNEHFEILPGDYVVLIKRFRMNDNTETPIEYFPYYYSNFTVESQSSSVYLGEITIEI